MPPPKGRTELYTHFATQFHCGEQPHLFSQLDLDAVEQALDTTLPLLYCHFMQRVGPVSTPAILDELVARQLQHADLNHLLSPEEVINNTKDYWAAGMSGDVIGIASDSMGSMIGFRRVSRKEIRPDDLPVWFFDHDYLTVECLAESFDALLSWYLSQLVG